jgi:hypothetical protein
VVRSGILHRSRHATLSFPIARLLIGSTFQLTIYSIFKTNKINRFVKLNMIIL